MLTNMHSESEQQSARLTDRPSGDEYEHESRGAVAPRDESAIFLEGHRPARALATHFPLSLRILGVFHGRFVYER